MPHFRAFFRRNHDKSLAPGCRRLKLEILESRAMPAIVTVTGTGDTIANDGFVTLREAITSINTGSNVGDALASGAYGQNDTIRFNIAGAPGTIHTIRPLIGLPAITKPVLIDGYSQLGSSQNTQMNSDNAFLAIELDGTNSGLTTGLTIGAGNSTVQGLVINNFKFGGIIIGVEGGNVIRGNFLGTDATGKLDRGNGGSGVALLASNNIVGGTDPASRNLISGNDPAGILISNPGVVGNVIQGNFIGTDHTGNGNLGNSGAGVRLLNVANNLIGGTAPGAGNRIAFNVDAGVQISDDAGAGNAVVGNAIFSNGGLGIDLKGDGPTPNDALDLDSGPNGVQNHPTLTAATTSAGVTTVAGTLQSTPNHWFVIELFANDAIDPTGFGEGQRFVGARAVTTNSLGRANFVFQTATVVPEGDFITATATEFLFNNTSEFTAALVVSVPGGIPGDANGDGKVDLMDFDILKDQFGQSGNRSADFDNSGDVGLNDFNILKQHFGQSAALESTGARIRRWRPLLDPLEAD
jgi:hypothetical protein